MKKAPTNGRGSALEKRPGGRFLRQPGQKAPAGANYFLASSFFISFLSAFISAFISGFLASAVAEAAEAAAAGALASAFFSSFFASAAKAPTANREAIRADRSLFIMFPLDDGSPPKHGGW